MSRVPARSTLVALALWGLLEASAPVRAQPASNVAAARAYTDAGLAAEVMNVSPCNPLNVDPFYMDSDKRADFGMPEGPASVGYAEADMATGRRACPRTEFGLGGRFAAIIDTPNFYGNLGVSGVLFGSFAINERTEVFATLEAVNYTYAVNASLSKTGLALGHLTAGATRVLYTPGHFVGSASVRLLLPTSFEIPGARLVGAELSHLTEWAPKTWLEVHTAVGVDFTAAISGAQALPRVGATARSVADEAPPQSA